jgi:hypothetical protein
MSPHPLRRCLAGFAPAEPLAVRSLSIIAGRIAGSTTPRSDRAGREIAAGTRLLYHGRTIGHQAIREYCKPPMMRFRRLLNVVLVFVCAVALGSCATATPTAAPPQPTPTDTVVYDVPTAPTTPSEPRPTTAAPTLPPAVTGAVTVPPPEERGPLPETRLTIMHTNDTQGYLDPCG